MLRTERNFAVHAEFPVHCVHRHAWFALTVSHLDQQCPTAGKRYFVTAAAALMFISALGGMLDPLLAIFHHIPRDYNEGWNAYWQATALQGGAMYPPVSSAVVNNYPPLSFYAIGLLGRYLGDNIIAGRWVALFSLFWISINVALWLRVSGSSRAIAALGGALCVSAFVSYAPHYIAMNDPQLLAHAVMTSALVVLWRFNRSSAIASACLMVIAGFIKHLLIPIPLATAALLALRRKRDFFAWLLAMTTVLAIGFSLAWLAYGASFFSALNLPRTYDARIAVWETSKISVLLSPLLVCMGIGTWSHLTALHETRVSDKALFAILYLIIAGASGALAAGGAGVDKNAFFDLFVACCLCTALAIEELSAKPAAIRGSLALVCMAFVAIAAVRLPREIEDISSLDTREREAGREVELIANLGNEHVACETLALCYWAKRPFAVDFFSYGQKLAKSVLPPSSCESLFGSGRIELVQVASDQERSTLGSDLLPDSCNAVIGVRFKRLHNSSLGALMLRDNATKERSR